MMMKTLKQSVLALSLSAASLTAMADDQLLKQLRETFPNTNIKSAERVEGIPGLIEMVMDRKIIYTNESGSLFVLGHLFDTARQMDLTQAKLNELMKVSYGSLPFDQAIKVVKGNGARQFAVFTDPACPFCQRLESELKKVDNYTMFVFTSPFKPAGGKLSEQIHCASNPAKAWTDFMQNGVNPKSESCDTVKHKEGLQLAQKLGVNGTPTLIGANGAIRPGYMPHKKLDAWLNANGKTK